MTGVLVAGIGNVFLGDDGFGVEVIRRLDQDALPDAVTAVDYGIRGVHLAYETLEGAEDLVIPPGTQNGRVFRLRGRGVPDVNGRGRGDLLVEVVVDTPTRLSKEEEELLRRLAAARGEEVAPPDTGFLARVRSAFK